MYFVMNNDKVQFITKICVVIHDNNAHYEYIQNVCYHNDEMCVVINNDNVY